MKGEALRKLSLYSRSANTKNIKKALNKGWIKHVKNGDRYFAISLYKIIENYSLGRGKLKCFKGDSLTELLARASAKYLEGNIVKQNIKEGNINILDKASTKSKCVRCCDESVVYSVRSLARLLGFESSTMGTKLFREMERLSLIARKRNSVYVADVSALGILTINPRLFVVGGEVYERLTSSVFVL